MFSFDNQMRLMMLVVVVSMIFAVWQINHVHVQPAPSPPMRLPRIPEPVLQIGTVVLGMITMAGVTTLIQRRNGAFDTQEEAGGGAGTPDDFKASLISSLNTLPDELLERVRTKSGELVFIVKRSSIKNPNGSISTQVILIPPEES